MIQRIGANTKHTTQRKPSNLTQRKKLLAKLQPQSDTKETIQKNGSPTSNLLRIIQHEKKKKKMKRETSSLRKKQRRAMTKFAYMYRQYTDASQGMQDV